MNQYCIQGIQNEASEIGCHVLFIWRFNRPALSCRRQDTFWIVLLQCISKYVSSFLYFICSSSHASSVCFFGAWMVGSSALPVAKSLLESLLSEELQPSVLSDESTVNFSSSKAVCVILKASKIDGKPDYLVVTILNPKQTLGQNGKNMQKWEWVKLVNDSGLRNEVGIHHSLSIHCAALWLQNYGCDWACDLKCGKFTSINGRIGRVVRPPGPVGVLDPARNPQMAVHIKMDRESTKVTQVLLLNLSNPPCSRFESEPNSSSTILHNALPPVLASVAAPLRGGGVEAISCSESWRKVFSTALLSCFTPFWRVVALDGSWEAWTCSEESTCFRWSHEEVAESEHSASMRQECLELYLPPGGERRHWDTSKKDTKKAPGSFQQRLQQKE